MSDLTSTCPGLARGERDLIHRTAHVMAWIWLQWRRRDIIRALNKVDDHLLRDAGIERGSIDTLVDTLIARRR